MKKILISALILLTATCIQAQSTYPIRADKVVIEKIGGSAELILKNSTRDSAGGLLINIGGGQTSFIKVRALNDSTIVIGLDTLVIRGNNPNLEDRFTITDDFTYTLPAGFAIESISVRSSIADQAGVKIGITDGGDEIDAFNPLPLNQYYSVLSYTNSAGTALPIYFTGITASTDVIVYKKKL